MKYQGSKKAYLEYILPILDFEKDLLKSDTYYEPFVGGANVIQYLDIPNKIGSDLNDDLIYFYNYIKDHGIDWIPDYLPPKEEYFDIIRNHKDDIPRHLYFAYKQLGSFNGCRGQGYGAYENVDNLNRNKVVLSKELDRIRTCKFICKDYRDIEYKKGSVIYLDPPYRGTRGYVTGAFNHKEYYEFAKELAKDNFVLMSEYFMPRPFKSIKWINAVYSINKQSDKKDAIEGLFVLKDGLGVSELIEHLRED